MFTDFRARQNFTGDLETRRSTPSVSGLGDLFETTNVETAAGLTSRFHLAPCTSAAWGSAVEPGVTVRVGHTGQTKSLLDPNDALTVWDRRIDAQLDTLDAGAYVDFDVRLFKRLHLSGGPRADLLIESIDDPREPRPRGHGARFAQPGQTSASRALPPARASRPRTTSPPSRRSSPTARGSARWTRRRLRRGARRTRKSGPWRRASARRRPGSATRRRSRSSRRGWPNELVFEAAAGGLQTENASVRRGVVGSVVAKPFDWLLVSSALSVTERHLLHPRGRRRALGPQHPAGPLPHRCHGARPLARWRGKPVTGRVGLGYTFLAGRHLTDAILGPSSNVLNAKAAVRYGWLEVGVDAYNLLALHYADDAEYYVSNWGFSPKQQRASEAIHITAAPPLTVLGTVGVYF